MKEEKPDSAKSTCSKKYLFLYVCLCVSLHICTIGAPAAHGGQKAAWDPLEPEHLGSGK